jgi:hypothetical protein
MTDKGTEGNIEKKCEFKGKNEGLNSMKLLSGVMLSLKPQMW